MKEFFCFNYQYLYLFTWQKKNWTTREYEKNNNNRIANIIIIKNNWNISQYIANIPKSILPKNYVTDPRMALNGIAISISHFWMAVTSQLQFCLTPLLTSQLVSFCSSLIAIWMPLLLTLQSLSLLLDSRVLPAAQQRH